MAIAVRKAKVRIVKQPMALLNPCPVYTPQPAQTITPSHASPKIQGRCEESQPKRKPRQKRQTNPLKQAKIPWEKENLKFRDWPFILIYMSVILGFAVVAGFSLQTAYGLYEKRIVALVKETLVRSNIPNWNLTNAAMFAVAIFLCVLLTGFLQLCGILLFYRAFIVSVLVMNCMCAIWLLAYSFNNKNWILFTSTLILVLLVSSFGKTIRRKLSFSKNVLKIGSRSMLGNSSIWIIYIAMLTVNSFMCCFYTLVLVSSYITWRAETELAIKYGILSFLMFTGFYLNEIFQNSSQVLVGAICAKWYFNSQVHLSKLVYSTFIRCFGSICFGSLCASIVSLLNEVAVLSKPTNQIMKYPVMKPIWKLTKMVSMLFNLMFQFFNAYAFAYISIHSTGYLRSSSKMFKMYNNKGYNTLVSECIINSMLRLYLIFTGIIGGITVYCIIQTIRPEYKENMSKIWIFVLTGVSISMQISRIISIIINAFVHAFFVCLIENRDLLQKLHPKEYRMIERFLD